MNANILAMHVVEGRTFTASELFNCCSKSEEPDWSQFDALELGGCVNVSESDDETWFEGGYDRTQAELFTVYGHYPVGGAEAITDACDFETAMEIAQHLQGRSGLKLAVMC